jgi:glycosyltransferase involved in cell wall biosynthesis
MVVLEALSAGRPVIGADAGGIPYLVEHNRTGLIYPAGDAPALASAITRLYHDEELCARMSTEARRAAEEKFDSRVTLATLMDVFSEVLARRHRPKWVPTPPSQICQEEVLLP